MEKHTPPDTAKAFLVRGMAFAKEGAYDQAIAEYNQAINIYPDYVVAFYNRGNAYTNLGTYDLAITDFNEAIRLDPDRRPAFYENRGNAYKKKGDTERARKDYARGKMIRSWETAMSEYGIIKETFKPSDIKWVKNVKDDGTHSAYLPPDERVIENTDGVFFCLQVNPNYTKSFEEVLKGDLILLYQLLESKTKKNYIKCFTHLVTPIGNKIIPTGNWVGRWVKAIAMTDNQAEKSIIFEDTGWKHTGFTGDFQDLSNQGSYVWEMQQKTQNIKGLSELQNEILTCFQPWPK